MTPQLAVLVVADPRVPVAPEEWLFRFLRERDPFRGRFPIPQPKARLAVLEVQDGFRFRCPLTTVRSSLIGLMECRINTIVDC
jgi:hypothetical protein